MRLVNKSQTLETSKILAQVKDIRADYIECKHLTSGVKIRAFITKNMQFELGQVVLLEFRTSSSGSGYIVVDELMEELVADVLEAQHIISNGMMYTSLILENPLNRQRLHSLIPNTNSLFSSANVIIKGDKVNIKLNNGNLFGIQYLNGVSNGNNNTRSLAKQSNI